MSVTVTHEFKGGGEAPLLVPEDVTVEEAKEKRKVDRLIPAGKNGTTMQLLLLIDDSARGSFGTQLETLRQFVSGLPQSTEIAIGYMRNGTNQMASNFTRDHPAAARTIRMPLGAGGADVSPYESLSDGIRKWPSSGAERKEVIMISSGIEGLGGGFTPDNPYVRRGIDDALKAGVIVYTIYNPSVGSSGRFFWRSTWGQNFLSQLADETGGEAYNINMGTPVSIEPFLKQIAEQFEHQYILTFEAKPENKAGLQPLKVVLKEKPGNVAAPSKIYVKASM